MRYSRTGKEWSTQMVTRRTARLCIMAIVSIGVASTLSGCQTVLGERAALADISSHLNEIQASVNDKLVSMAPDETFELDPGMIYDLRGRTEAERHAVGSPVVGIYALEQSADYLGLDVVVAGRGNEGGFSNANRSFYTCVLIEGVPGVGESKLIDRDCPQEIVNNYVVSYTAVKLQQLNL